MVVDSVEWLQQSGNLRIAPLRGIRDALPIGEGHGLGPIVCVFPVVGSGPPYSAAGINGQQSAAARIGPEKCPPQFANGKPACVKTFTFGNVSAQ